MTIRRALAKDLAAVDKLLYQVEDIHRRGRPDLFRLGAKKYSDEELLDLFGDDSRPVFVAVDEDDSVLGYAFCELQEVSGTGAMLPRKTLYIDDLCVDESGRGRGVGRRLYDHVLRTARLAGCHNVTLHAWECNPEALGFYRHLGMRTLYTALETLVD